MSKVLGSSAEAIGKTPLVRLDRLTKFHNVKGTILAKLEYLNPGFSKKDRAALGIIEEAEKSGMLAPGQTVGSIIKALAELLTRSQCAKRSGATPLKYLAPSKTCLLYTSPSPRDATLSRMPSSA